MAVLSRVSVPSFQGGGAAADFGCFKLADGFRSVVDGYQVALRPVYGMAVLAQRGTCLRHSGGEGHVYLPRAAAFVVLNDFFVAAGCQQQGQCGDGHVFCFHCYIYLFRIYQITSSLSSKPRCVAL